MELLILLLERGGELVSREQIAECLWGKGVFLDVDHSINTAIRKIRVVLRDDPEKPRFIETVIGRGYRFAAPISCSMSASAMNSKQCLLQRRDLRVRRLNLGFHFHRKELWASNCGVGLGQLPS
jgi:DNA-binding winged helix-turn-helix (wHTH) protein